MTCGDVCRKKRSVRMRESNLKDGGLTVRVAEKQEIQDVAREVMKEELRPVVREALTEDALRGVRDLLGLLPTAVESLKDDLAGEDAVLKQRAATLVVKYTLGHPALVRADDTADTKQIVVNFALPRPGVLPDQVDGTSNGQVLGLGEAEGEAEELRKCELCSIEKGVSQFAEDSYRCLECHEELRRKVLERVGAG